MSTLQNAKTLLYTLGPFLLPYIYSNVRKYWVYSKNNKAQRRPVPRRIGIALNLLFVATTIALISSFYAFSYENVITKTNSRLQTSSTVLWERVALRRPNKALTELDEKLKVRLTSTEGRCLYLMYGPDTTGNCPFCNSDNPDTFFYYALPSILLPHFLNLLLLGLCTSSAVGGKEGKRFRGVAIIIGSLLALAEVIAWNGYDWKDNAKVVKASELFHFYGWARFARNIAIALTDAGFAFLLWATSTNRLMVVPPSAGERIEGIIKTLELGGSKQSAASIIHNTTVRSEKLHSQEYSHWTEHEAKIKEMMQEKAIQRAITRAQSDGRLDTTKIGQEAERYAETLIPLVVTNMNGQIAS
jgi:hypothetical protein